MNDKKPRLCYRCEYRAKFLETGHGPRSECHDAQSSVYSCYMFEPNRPLLLVNNKNDNRPVVGFVGSMMSSRQHIEDIINIRSSILQTKFGNIYYYEQKQIKEEVYRINNPRRTQYADILGSFSMYLYFWDKGRTTELVDSHNGCFRKHHSDGDVYPNKECKIEAKI